MFVRRAFPKLPLRVPLVENNADEFAEPIIESYIKSFIGHNIEAIILGCTHYPHYKKQVAEIALKVLNKKIAIISQDEFIPKSLENYLERHPEIDKDISKNGKHSFEITDTTEAYIIQAKSILRDENVVISKVDI